ncbi:MAG TPA: LysR family transcriptional regulator [Candidatus Scybalocola faecavium]|nr:LysR family transcriptional regulator [Candidatus Scybalocola faecavium]
MLLRQMKYFVAVIDCNSFTEAAEQCYISQSAISQQIQSLERELGVELIHRENRRFTITPTGQHFYSHCKAILGQVDDMIRETKRLGQDKELQLRIGYLRCYSGLELYQAVAEFSRLYPEVSINIVNGTHEELYDLLRFGGVDLVLNDQRRAFSNKYINYELMQCGCYAELSTNHPLSGQNQVRLEQLQGTPCILIASREQRNTEREYYQNTLGFGGSYLFADNLEEGRLLVLSNRGFLPVESVGTLPPPSASIQRLPIYQGEQQIMRNYCAFWRKDQTNYYMEEFADLLKKLMTRDKQGE